ncbi:autophagy-related protein 16 [Dendryphion nanum]|uniref:Autophagy-related protein 16 n=1 Tax=Dendryphion nanum TaxID=256645 RepID=A0A9P9E849_9PLEO|nr:autophagy-related protein 16 [Dendryphion nanum]
MSNPFTEYLSALDARDAREQAHVQYIKTYTKLADRTARLSQHDLPTVHPSASALSGSGKTIRPGTPKGSGSPVPPDSNVAQIRAELASTQKIRGDLEAQLAAQTSELTDLKLNDQEQQKRIVHLERIKEQLERRAKDRTEELKGKGRFVEEVQDEMVAIELQLNMAERDRDKLKKENEDLTRRWMEKMEAEARKMNDNMDEEIAQKKKWRK